MARNKKSKRPNVPQETLERARAELRGDTFVANEDGEVAVAPKIRTTSATGAAASMNKVRRAAVQSVRRIPTVEDLLGEYRYVLRDLRNLAFLAGGLLIAILVLSFVLGHISG